MYLAIVSATPENKLAKYQAFESESDADIHVTEYGGFVAPEPVGSQEYWTVDMASKTITGDTVQEQADLDEQAWKLLMIDTDKDMPRWAEDIWDAMGDGAAIQRTKDLLADKKSKRSRKP